MSAVYSAANLYRPEPIPFERFDDARAAVERLTEIYDRNTAFLRQAFQDVLHGRGPSGRVRACYPALRISVQTYDLIDSRLSYGHVAEPGRYQTTITQPALFTDYLAEQIGLLLQNHGVPVEVGESDMPIPLHFAFPEGAYVEGEHLESLKRPLRDLFDVPDLAVTDDAIVNGSWRGRDGEPHPLAPFTATRVDYSLHRLQHYTATAPLHFQNFVLFTNYQFYVDEFCVRARALMAEGGGDYDALVEPGNRITRRGETASPADPGQRLPQMPAYHLIRPNHSGITLVNIGVGPSNAKTITDHIAVLRPHAWLMLGHCAGLRDSQRLGDYVLAHGYVRDDHVLDATCRPGSRCRRWPKCRWRWSRPCRKWRACRAGTSNASCAPVPWPPSTTATGSCATRASWCSVSRSRAPSPWTWNRPPSRPMGFASGCPMAPCSVSRTSPCTGS